MFTRIIESALAYGSHGKLMQRGCPVEQVITPQDMTVTASVPIGVQSVSVHPTDIALVDVAGGVMHASGTQTT